MHSSSYLTLALFSTYALADGSLPGESSRSEIIDNLDSLASSLYANPTISADINTLEASIPTSIAPALESKVEADVISYVADLIKSPQFTSAVAPLESIVPSSVQAQISAAPADFIISLITETRYPPWASAIPTPLAKYFFSIANHVASIASDDLVDALPTPTKRISGPYSVDRGRYPYPTATGTGHRTHHRSGHHAHTEYEGPVYPTGTGWYNGPSYPTGTGAHPSGTGVIRIVTEVHASGSGVAPTGGAGASNGTAPAAGTASPSLSQLPIVGAASRSSGAAGFTAAIVIVIGALLLI